MTKSTVLLVRFRVVGPKESSEVYGVINRHWQCFRLEIPQDNKCYNLRLGLDCNLDKDLRKNGK